MVVVIQQYTKDESLIGVREKEVEGAIERKEKVFERLIECDQIYKRKDKDSVGLSLFKNDKAILVEDFTEKTKIFIMEQGRTIDRIEFKVNDK